MNQHNIDILNAVKGGLVVSCQALPDEPLHSSFIMSRMALAAFQGGAVGIRANTVEDITEIRKTVDLPIIGIIKEVYPDSEVYITPTMKEVDALMACGVEVLAMDATKRTRPNGRELKEFFTEVRAKYPEQLFMADCSSQEEGMAAAEMGFDLIGTTMAGYTTYTKGRVVPPFDMIEYLVKNCGKPVIAEGNIGTPEQLREALDLGVHCAVVGGAITRPLQITRKFTAVIKK
ncbi:MAG: N-acetylmannosamine-6-phosphate 2-epimerase [Solobacterium sp.]|jgi:N-acylglucosamine-6-phosphate 2-epimerase|nr:N-acetylmannosamine-6-phosphate 2-epimerase [Solobacterium sp.]MCH4221998.1 N-acetylmannosamine-6-phosphate 2-epimerase [Solobacterium sp.]MCH4266111.1 N-acetylmannosamine-6-phosphate 2-epimerase [Solobacterium sp.]